MRGVLFLLTLLLAWSAPPVRAQTGTGSGPPDPVPVLSLQDAVQLALGRSLALELETAELARVRAELAEAAAAGRPKVNLGAYLAVQDAPMIYYGMVEPSFYAMLPPGTTLDVNAMAMLPLFTGGLFAERVAAAEAAERAALARLGLRLREVALDVRTGYSAVVLERANLAAAERSVDEAREVLRIAQEQLEVGRAARYVVLRARAETADAEQDRNRAAAALVRTEAALKVLLAVDPAAPLAWQDELEPIAWAGTLEENLNTALSDRPDLTVARASVDEARARVAAAEAESSPQVYLTGMAEAQAPGFRRVDTGFSVGAVASLPIFDGGERRARAAAARAVVRTREIELRQRELEIRGEVLTARAELEAARANVELARAEVEEAQEELRLARLRFQVGRGLHLEVLDALAAASRARANLARNRHEAFTASANLLFVTGRY